MIIQKWLTFIGPFCIFNHHHNHHRHHLFAHTRKKADLQNGAMSRTIQAIAHTATAALFNVTRRPIRFKV